VNLFEWNPATPAAIVDLRVALDRQGMIDDYHPSPELDDPSRVATLEKIVAHAMLLGATSALIEYRYIDADWRAEHATYYSRAFRQYPNVAHRIHFFRDPIELPTGDVAEDFDPDFSDFGYLGYTVLRPLPSAPVGRTMLPPTHDDSKFIRCAVRDSVSLFGRRLKIIGAPFASQDGQLGGCGHASVWITAYYHHAAIGHPRHLPDAVAASVSHGIGLGRPSAKGGATVYQLSTAFRELGLDPIVYHVGELEAAEDDADFLVRRYLDSGLPVTIVANKHTQVLVGYDESAETSAYFAQDDQEGPYIRTSLPVASRDDEAYIIVPLPSKVFLPGEHADSFALQKIAEICARVGNDRAAALHTALVRNRCQTRTLVLPSNVFKERAPMRYSGGLSSSLRYHPMPRFVWVTQFVAAIEGQKLGVVAEALMDATESMQDPHLLAYWVPGDAELWWPDEGVPESIDDACDMPPLNPHAPGLGDCEDLWNQLTI
jgi:hypothetical protein